MATQKELEEKMDKLASLEKVGDLEGRVRKVEQFIEYENFRNKINSLILSSLKGEDFRNKVKNLFNEFLKVENFTNKVSNIASKEVKDYIDKSRIKIIFWVIGLIVIAVCIIIISLSYASSVIIKENSNNYLEDIWD